MSKKKKIGIMGGTFDPIHIGHLILAENALESFQLDKILVMPSGNPPHKPLRKGRASTRQRVEMTRLAIEGHKSFELSLIEVHREGYTYTHDTLEQLNKEHPDEEYYFIMGVDSLFAFDTWMHPEIIAKNCRIIVAMRDAVDEYTLDEQIKFLKEEYGAVVYKLNNPNLDISSHMIRQKIKDHLSIEYLVPDQVIEYIAKEKLYLEGCDESKSK
ncbi:MAG TPA: nicotinate-nucleotide adenylyltransferase [Candidatus Merdenecus merdavium]|nr:nicotinate-nucleotide adenylyltransferase [Candidatus Merdenecus merdavium]